MKQFDNDQMIQFLWDQVKRLSEWTRQRDGQVQQGYGDMCKLENHGMIPHLVKEEAPLPIENETIPEAPPEPEPELEPIIEEVVPEIIEEVVEEVVKDVVPEIVDPEPKPIEADNIDDLLEQYKKKLEE